MRIQGSSEVKKLFRTFFSGEIVLLELLGPVIYLIFEILPKF